VTWRLGLEGPSANARIAALSRLSLVPLMLLSEPLETPHSPQDLPFADPLTGVLVVYVVLSLVYAYGARREVRLAPFCVADTVLLGLLVYGEGGAVADVRFMLCIPTLIAAFLAGPRLTLQLTILSVAAFVAASLAHPSLGRDFPLRFVVVHGLDLAWRGGLAVVMSYFLMRRSERIRQLAESRRSLVAQALTAEARARRELAYALHDELVQELLTAQQDVTAARRGRVEYLERAQRALGVAVDRLRRQIFRLHPPELERAGLAAALEALAAQQPLPDGSLPIVVVAPDATGVDDELLFSVGRELLTNAMRHAGARSVSLTVERDGDRIVLSCRDDGLGMARRRRDEALAQGHLGLAACTERVESLGGMLELAPVLGGGTCVRAAIPASPAPAAGAAAVAPARALSAVPG
jgi:two-component system NarL family sensor kinase